MRAVAKCLPAMACALVLAEWSGALAQGHPELRRVYLGSDKLMPSVVSRVLPGYPASERGSAFSGDIDVETVVSTTGSVIHAWATPPDPGAAACHAAALAAAREWRFRPALLGNGTPLPVLVLLRMTFKGPRGNAAPETSAKLMTVPRVPARAKVPAFAFQSVPPGTGLGLIRSVQPQYTAQALQRSVQGAVTLNILVLPDGTVGEVTVAKSLDRQYGLDEEAIAAARYWLFEPAIDAGSPVAVRTTLVLEFRLR
jgi:TonB family protein